MTRLRAVSNEQTPRFELLPFDRLQPSTERAYLIKGLIPRVGLTVLWGPPKSAKSFWAFDAMMHVALGWDYRGRCVHQGAVVYLACEGASGYSNRAEAFRLSRLTESHSNIPFYLITAPVNLVADASALVESIRAQLDGEHPAAITIDTLNRTLPGSESSDEDMGAYIRAVDALRDAFACAIVVVHHSGVDGSRPRGHTSLTGAAEAQLSVKRNAKGTDFTVTVEWLKDGPEGDTIVCRLLVVEIGRDEDGDPITSCVVEEAKTEPGTSAPTRKPPPRNKNAADALRALVATVGKPLPNAFGLSEGTQAVPVDCWKKELLSRGVIERDSTNPRQDFKRIKEALRAHSVIAEREGQVWLV
jgi:hypothetical protein